MRLVEIWIDIGRKGMEARGLGNIGAMAVIGKLSPSEQKSFSEQQNGN